MTIAAAFLVGLMLGAVLMRSAAREYRRRWREACDLALAIDTGEVKDRLRIPPRFYAQIYRISEQRRKAERVALQHLHPSERTDA